MSRNDLTGPISTVTDTGIELRPDHRRVIHRFFVHGRDDPGPSDSRAAPVIERVLQLDEHDVETVVDEIDARFSHRHRDIHRIFSDHASRLESRVGPDIRLSAARRLLLGAAFTSEYAFEGAALCNPSAVLHPRQDSDGTASFILSVCCIGEGPRSSIGFRTGTISPTGTVFIDRPGAFPLVGTVTPGIHDNAVFRAKLAELGEHGDNAAFVLDHLPLRFDDADLTACVDTLAAGIATRDDTAMTIAHLRALARTSYQVDFPTDSDISERLLWPHSPAERQGIEDARFVRFINHTGAAIYYGTYTAFDGTNISQQLLETTDFRVFASSSIAGSAAADAGLALFPRMIHGRYAALARGDHENIALAYSDELHCWHDSIPIEIPTRPWGIAQLDNGGSPIETDAGWLVLIHEVGPMRSYSLGAILLDIDEPQRVLARSQRPIISPTSDQRDGYVPNVIYTCGAFAHNDTLLLPYSVADQSIGIATLSIDQLLETMRPSPAP